MFIPENLYFRIFSFLPPTKSAQIIKNHVAISQFLYDKIWMLLEKELKVNNFNDNFIKIYLFVNQDTILDIIKEIFDEFCNDIEKIYAIEEEFLLEYIEQKFSF